MQESYAASIQVLQNLEMTGSSAYDADAGADHQPQCVTAMPSLSRPSLDKPWLKANAMIGKPAGHIIAIS